MSIPGVDGCLFVWLPSAGGVLVELSRLPEEGLMVDGETAPCGACTTALWGSVGGGRVVLARGDG